MYVALILSLMMFFAAAAVGAEGIERFTPGTTIATNALLERRGARVALVTNEGFGDLVEIARQIRLRDIGGIIVCDFIDMDDEVQRKRVLDHFSRGLERDRARTRVGRVSSLGLIELTRKRTGESVTQEITDICPMCLGVGRIPSRDTVSLWIERDMWRRHADEGDAFLVEAHPSVIEALIGSDGEAVENLEHKMRRGIYIRANVEMEYEEYEITSGTIAEFDRKLMPYRRAQVVEVNVRRPGGEGKERAIGWTDDGFFIELLDADAAVGNRARVSILDLRRSYGVGDVIPNAVCPFTSSDAQSATIGSRR
ncbi:MAG: hypothetical protein C4320_08205 [Armatimonadota bacterium]